MPAQIAWYYRLLRDRKLINMHRTPAPRLFLLLLLLLISSAALLAAFRHSTVAAATEPKIQPAGPAPSPQPQPFMHTVKRGEGLPAIARQYLSRTPYMTVTELESATAEANKLQKLQRLQPGQQLVIPGYSDQPVVEHSVAVPKD